MKIITSLFFGFSSRANKFRGPSLRDYKNGVLVEGSNSAQFTQDQHYLIST